MTQVTYTPLENGDPIEVLISGQRFFAGRTRDVSAGLMVGQLISIPTPMPDKPNATSARETRVPLIDVLAQNPHFAVEGHVQVASVNSDLDDMADTPRNKGGRPRNPRTPEEYRMHATKWINRIRVDPLEQNDQKAIRGAAKAMSDKWHAETDLRIECGVGGDDVELIMATFRPKYDSFRGEWPLPASGG